MKYLKALGLAVMAAMAVMAFAGSGTASAAVLCEVTPTGSSQCPSASSYGPGTIIQGTAVNARLTPNGLFPDVVCTHSATEAEVTSTGGTGEAVEGQILDLDFTGCKTTTGSNCTVTVQNLPYAAAVHATSEHDGLLTAESGGSGNPGALVFCAGIINCSFDNNLFELPIEGGNPAAVVAEGVELNIAGGLICPTEAEWDAKYVATGENPNIWVAESEE